MASAAAFAAADSTYNFTSDLPYTALDFFTVPFFVPDGISEIQVDHSRTDSTTTNILDWGLSNPNEVVGWGGGLTDSAIVGVNATSRGYQLLPSSNSKGSLTSGNWSVIVGKPRIETAPGSYSINVTLRAASTLPAQTERTSYIPSPPLDIPTCAAPGLSTAGWDRHRDRDRLKDRAAGSLHAAKHATHEERGTDCLGWYAGDFHVHSRESGDAYANASADEIALFAATQGLDFVHFSDHNTPSLSSYLVDAQSRHSSGQGRTLLLPGVEFTTYYGHAGALFTTQFVDFRMNWPRSGSTPVTITAAVQAIHAQGGLFSINHLDIYIPSSDPDGDEINSCVGCYWDFDGALPSSMVDAMEVGIQSYAGTIPEGQVASPLAIQHWDHMHALGYTQVAPISGSDDHHGGQNDGVASRREGRRRGGTKKSRGQKGVRLPTTLANGHKLASAIGSPATMVLAANLSHAAIREGVALGRTVVKFWHATDWMVDMTACYTADSRKALRAHSSAACVSGLARVGATLSSPSSSSAQVQLTATVTLPGVPPGGQPNGQYFLALVRNNEQWFRANITSAPFTYNVTVPVPVAGTDRWRAEVHESLTGILHTLTNHIFLPSYSA